MEDFLRSSVWPHVARERLMVLRLVLHNAPFKVRTVSDMVRMPFTPESILLKVDVELSRRSLPTVSPQERELLCTFVAKHRSGESSFIDVESLSSSSAQEPARQHRRLA